MRRRVAARPQPIGPLANASLPPLHRSSGEFQLVDKFGEDERPYLETQGTDWFQLWAFANVANFGRGSHTMNKMGPDGSSLDFHFWFPCVAGPRQAFASFVSENCLELSPSSLLGYSGQRE
jgi:hypothetical protein